MNPLYIYHTSHMYVYNSCRTPQGLNIDHCWQNWHIGGSRHNTCLDLKFVKKSSLDQTYKDIAKKGSANISSFVFVLKRKYIMTTKINILVHTLW